MQDANNQVGIEESKVVFSLIGTSVRAVANLDTNKDGTIQTLEILNGVQVIALKALRNLPDIRAFRSEAVDYTEAEKAELIETLHIETQIPSAKLDVLFTRAANIILNVADLVIDAARPESDFIASTQV